MIHTFSYDTSRYIITAPQQIRDWHINPLQKASLNIKLNLIFMASLKETIFCYLNLSSYILKCELILLCFSFTFTLSSQPLSDSMFTKKTLERIFSIIKVNSWVGGTILTATIAYIIYGTRQYCLYFLFVIECTEPLHILMSLSKSKKFE